MAVSYAIGDVHGRDDLLRLLLEEIETSSGGDRPRLIFLGDIVDRGPDSKEALEIVDRALLEFPGSQLILGNHDERFLRAMQSDLPEHVISDWLYNLGGLATLGSYFGGEHAPFEVFRSFVRDYYDHHLELLENAIEKAELGSFLMVHAGVRPGVSLDDQESHDLRWIRDEFLAHKDSWEKVIVHGHSITASRLPEVHANRIALDTGAYGTGRLSAAVFENEELRGFICAEMDGELPAIRRFDAQMNESAVAHVV